MTYTQSSLWNRAFGDDPTDIHREHRGILRSAFFALRKQAEMLVTNIGSDLRQYTIHDISHLDALWGIASEIVGPEFDITPTEGFVLGASFLLHDAGMCLAAYPGGLDELKGHQQWLSTLRKNAKNIDVPTEEEVSATVGELIRAEHANRARDLPSVEWVSPSGARFYLLENTDLRQKFSNAIGDVSASHWWSHDRLASDLDRILPASPPFPTEWRVDLLKIAAILRVSDAAHIDERRAPGFVWALRGPALNTVSNLHWLFQNRITQPERRDDALHYSSTSDFGSSDAEAWWLANDALRMIDRELRSTDVLLADLRGAKTRLAARRVANVESIATMVLSIRVHGWIPIDTSIKISDIPNLIRSLGGEALYGDGAIIPLRELLQNAADAIRLKAEVLPEFTLSDGLIHASLGVDELGPYLQVTDNGIGMTRDILGGAFLDFGNSGWSSDPIFADYPGVDPQKLNMIGKFGIGFFSVFMLGDKVEVITRRFDRAFQYTLVLSFSGGVGRRPILRQSVKPEWLVSGGTTIKVWIKNNSKPVSTFFGNDETTLGRVCEKLFPLTDIRIRTSVEGVSDDIASVDWRVMSAEELLKRVNGKDSLPDFLEPYISNMRPIYDSAGIVAGRMFVSPSRYTFMIEDSRWMESELSGMVVSRGVYVSSINGIQGVVEGDVKTANRLFASPKPSRDEFYRWLAEQADLLANMNLSLEEEAACAVVIRRLCGDCRDLGFVKSSEGLLSTRKFRDFALRSNEIKIASNFDLWNLARMNPAAKVDENLVTTESGFGVVFQYDSRAGKGFDDYLSGESHLDSEDELIHIVGQCWGFDEALIAALKGGEVGGRSVERSMVIARSLSGEEIIGHGVHCWKGMTIDDLRFRRAS